MLRNSFLSKSSTEFTEAISKRNQACKICKNHNYCTVLYPSANLQVGAAGVFSKTHPNMRGRLLQSYSLMLDESIYLLSYIQANFTAQRSMKSRPSLA